MRWGIFIFWSTPPIPLLLLLCLQMILLGTEKHEDVGIKHQMFNKYSWEKMYQFNPQTEKGLLFSQWAADKFGPALVTPGILGRGVGEPWVQMFSLDTAHSDLDGLSHWLLPQSLIHTSDRTTQRYIRTQSPLQMKATTENVPWAPSFVFEYISAISEVHKHPMSFHLCFFPTTKLNLVEVMFLNRVYTARSG